MVPQVEKPKVHLTDEQRDEYKAAFSIFDENGDGTINTEELGKVMSKFVGRDLTKSELDLLVEQIDYNHDGSISFDEFVDLMTKHMDGYDADTEARQIFNVIDKDGSGLISPKELKDTMRDIGEYLGEEQIDMMIKEVDKNGDGQIDFEEFKLMLRS